MRRGKFKYISASGGPRTAACDELIEIEKYLEVALGIQGEFDIIEC
jgi:hypothetical protein